MFHNNTVETFSQHLLPTDNMLAPMVQYLLCMYKDIVAVWIVL